MLRLFDVRLVSFVLELFVRMSELLLWMLELRRSGDCHASRV